MNTTLSDSVKDMSATLGELQAKEEQLKTLIQHKVNYRFRNVSTFTWFENFYFYCQIVPWFPYHIKDRELVNASAQITEMISRLKKLDDQYREMRRKEVEGQKNVVEWKEKYAESRKEIEHLKGR